MTGARPARAPLGVAPTRGRLTSLLLLVLLLGGGCGRAGPPVRAARAAAPAKAVQAPEPVADEDDEGKDEEEVPR